MEMCNANNPAENNPLQRMPAIISALHLIFWGGLIVVIDIRINRFDIVNDVIGAFIIAAGVFRLADLPVDRTYATQMSYVRVTSVVFVVHCIVVDLLGLEATGGLQVILSLAALAEFAAIVVFCLAMRRLSNSAGLASSAYSWRTTTLLFLIVYAPAMCFGVAAGLYAAATGARFTPNVTPHSFGAMLMLVVVVLVIFAIPVVHLFVSTSRMAREAEQLKYRDSLTPPAAGPAEC